MTLGNMRELGAQRLVACCLNDACRHMALIDVSSYLAVTILAAETEPICAELLEARAEDALLRPLVRCYPVVK